MAFVWITGCGKITQIPNQGEEAKSFDVAYSVDCVPTDTIKVASSYPGLFTTADTPLYARIIGFKKAIKQQDELSWGKAILSLAGKSENPTLNSSLKKKYKSLSFRKDGLELTQADHTWTKLVLDPAQSVWRAENKKVEKNYGLYLLCLYSKDKVAFKPLYENLATGNKTVEAGPITPYDTFISILFLMHWDDTQSLTYIDTIEKLKAFYTPAVFALLGSKLPLNTGKRFDPNTPVFVWEGKYEKSLLRLFTLAQTNKPSAAIYLKDLPDDIVPDKAKEALGQLMQKIK